MSTKARPRTPTTASYWVKDLQDVVRRHGPIVPIQMCSCGGYAFRNEDAKLVCLMCGKVKP